MTLSCASRALTCAAPCTHPMASRSALKVAPWIKLKQARPRIKMRLEILWRPLHNHLRIAPQWRFTSDNSSRGWENSGHGSRPTHPTPSVQHWCAPPTSWVASRLPMMGGVQAAYWRCLRSFVAGNTPSEQPCDKQVPRQVSAKLCWTVGTWGHIVRISLENHLSCPFHECGPLRSTGIDT